MKKNKTMRAASFLLVLTLMTSCFVGSTFAKYTSTAEASDTARVAKWGVTITANGTTFADSYAKDDNVSTVTGATVVTSGSVGDAIVAPGTQGELIECTISGTPEVAVKVEYKAELTLTNWSLSDSSVYCPIIFTVNSQKYKIGDAGITSTADLETAVEEAIADYTAEYEANTDLSIESTVATPDVSWEWPFKSGTDSSDTDLGNQASNGNSPTIELKVTTSVTQIN